MMRTHTCGELNVKQVGQRVRLCGWVESRRDHGGVIFIDLRDREGITQVVFNPGQGEGLFQQANQLRSEYVILVEGEVKERPAGTENKKLPTGEIEILSDKIEVLNSCERLPFEINAGVEIGEDLRLTYRYLDLRRQGMLKNLRLRHRLCKIIRDYLDREGFLEVETPILTKSTPEGARDFLVPSRLNPGKFYALPQSPQLFKQLLMVSGFEKYFQIARCFRDEDLRADRQPEFTQLDVEMSFITEEDIYRLNEGLIHEIFKNIMNIDLKVPFLRMGYQEAMARFGNDRPDMRFGAELVDLSDELKGSGFKVFDGVLGNGGKVKGINAKKCAEFSHSQIEELTKFAADFGAPGLAWFKIVSGGLQSPIAKFISKEKSDGLMKKMGAENGDLLLLVAAKEEVVRESLGRLRLHLADKMNWINKKEFNFLWVVDFPLFKYNDEEKRWEAEHHPFTNFKEEDLPLFEKDPGKIRSRAYDMVVNGVEIGGGSIRIHKREMQEKLFKAIGIEEDEARERFGFLLEAFKYGAPPHGGIAFGIDRLVALLSGVDSIREVIAFPKTQKGLCLMTQAPSGVDSRQLKETHIRLAEK